jgi:hypothetical protein
VKINAPTWAAYAGIPLTIAVSVVATAISWGHNSEQLNNLTIRANLHGTELESHTKEIEALNTHIAVEDAKLDALKETLGRIEDKLDAKKR